ncbi:MAG: putative aminoglycoside phosphotransferase [Myxococcales bacterium]|nr:putative aminoglycoside phosphotransferase [Myxococcales bacterium]
MTGGGSPIATIDGARAVRPGEELDARALARFLGWDEVRVTQFPSGHSNLTYLVEGGGKQLVLRRPPFGSKVKSAHDMGREFKILSRLHAVYPAAPKPVAYTEDTTILGAPFYVMERIVGVILRKHPPAELLTPAVARGLGEAFVDNLATLHGLDWRAAGLDIGKPEGYVERQVSGWADRYRNAHTDDIADMEFLEKWLKEHLPRESGATLIHNDYKYDNLVLAADDLTRIIGVLDWEMSTVGDPLMDLGTALGYWVELNDPPELQMVAFCATNYPGSLTRQELVARYRERTGRDTGDMLFYYAFALFKTAGVAQQIYYRFKQGLTHDERFAMMIVGVKVLSQTAVAAIQRGHI